MRRSAWIRGAIAGLVGGVAWFLAIMAVFGPAQLVLADPELQSRKMLAAFTEEPLPRAAEAPWILIAGVLVIGMLWGLVYVWLTQAGDLWSDRSWRGRGLRFGAIGWLLMVPWFGFYLPWNVLREPALLVALEMVCWAAVLLAVGLTTAGVERLLRRGA